MNNNIMNKIVIQYRKANTIVTSAFYLLCGQEIVLGEEEAFTIVHDSDESRCGERLVCELAQRERRGLATDEESILSLVK